MLDWLIYHQSECQGEDIFINFPCASKNVSYQWASAESLLWIVLIVNGDI